jgi:hypothetical protein
MTKEEATQRLIDMGIIPATAATATAPATASSVEKTPSPESLKKDAMGDCGLDASELMARLTKVEKMARVKVSPESEMLVDGLCAFVSEWTVEPSARMVSTFVQACKSGLGRDFIVSRFALSQELGDLAPEVEKKCESEEFKKLVETAQGVGVGKTVNSRFAIFYGKPGSGKSTFVKAQFPTADRYFCSEDRRAIDLVSEVALDFESGKKGFVPSTIARAMEEGKPVILDEINLLDPSVLCSVQAMVDDTDYIEVAGKRFVIRSGFCVIGTMNLETGMGQRPLPDALVDRACVLRKFEQPSTKTRAAWAGLI